MKTYEDFRNEIIENVDVPKSHAQIETMAAKEYAKQWIHEFALQTFHYLDARDYDQMIRVLQTDIYDKIDRQ